jgi:hypothetical protein
VAVVKTATKKLVSFDPPPPPPPYQALNAIFFQDFICTMDNIVCSCFTLILANLSQTSNIDGRREYNSIPHFPIQ